MISIDRVSAAHLHLPGWFVKLANEADGELSIYIFEICASTLPGCVAHEPHDGAPRSCVLCIDNQAALDAIVKGSSTSELGTILVGVLDPIGPNPHSAVARVCQRKIK